MTEGIKKQLIYERLMATRPKTGNDIAKNTHNAELDRKEVYDALSTLCKKRNCYTEQASEGDTAPIRLLRAQLKESDQILSDVSNTQYVKLSDVIAILNIEKVGPL